MSVGWPGNASESLWMSWMKKLGRGKSGTHFWGCCLRDPTPEKQKMNGNRSVATERRIKRNLCINVVKLQYNGDLQIFTDLPKPPEPGKTADFFSSYLIIRLYAVAVLINTTRRQACSLRDCYQHRNSGKKKKNKSTKKTKLSIISCLCFRKYVIG